MFGDSADVAGAFASFRKSSGGSQDILSFSKISIEEVYESLSQATELNLSHKLVTALRKTVENYEAWRRKYENVVIKGT